MRDKNVSILLISNFFSSYCSSNNPNDLQKEVKRKKTKSKWTVHVRRRMRREKKVSSVKQISEDVARTVLIEMCHITACGQAWMTVGGMIKHSSHI